MSDEEKSNLQQAYEKDGALVASGVKTFNDGVSIGKDLSKGNMRALAGDVQGATADATSFAAEAVTAASDPLNYLISKGLGFLEDWLTPLKDAIQMVTGDSEKLSECAEKFDKVAADLNKLAADVVRTAGDGGSGWMGTAAPAAGERFGETRDSLESSSSGAGHIAALLKMSSMLMKAAYDIINGILADLIEWLVITWLAALAAEIPTCGASTAAATTASTAEITVEGGKAAEEVGKVSKILRKVMDIIKKVLKFLRESKVFKKADEFRAGGKGFLRNGIDATKGEFKDELKKSVTKNLRAEVGLPDSGAGAADWAKAATNDIPQKAGDFAGGVGDAYNYGTDPGSESGYGQSQVPPSEQEMIDRYGFPSNDPDLEQTGGQETVV